MHGQAIADVIFIDPSSSANILCMKILFSILAWFIATPLLADSPDAKTIITKAIEYWRDNTSYIEAEMKVHRPGWERNMSMIGWTKGRKQSLVRFTAPAKDAGNASLTIDDEMWSFSPKINRVIKIPPSMKSQSWMGSDFSYDDLSRDDKIIDQYTHRLIDTKEENGEKVYIIESIPLEEAPVPWGKEILHVRKDNIILRHLFFDQNMKLVKQLNALSIEILGGKTWVTKMQMQKIEEADEWTEISHKKVEFGIPLTEALFTQSNLRNPR